jgi:hypothetical protein
MGGLRVLGFDERIHELERELAASLKREQEIDADVKLTAEALITAGAEAERLREALGRITRSEIPHEHTTGTAVARRMAEVARAALTPSGGGTPMPKPRFLELEPGQGWLHVGGEVVHLFYQGILYVNGERASSEWLPQGEELSEEIGKADRPDA